MYTLGQLEQRIRRILFEEQVDRFTAADIQSWINDGVRELWKTLRSTKEDIFVKIMKSSDASQFLIDRTYNPSSFKIVAGTSTYDLPPDFISLKYYMPASLQYSFTRFYPSDMSDNIFDYLKNDTIRRSGAFVYDIIGNQIVIAPTPALEIDIEMGYSYRVSPLRRLEGQSSGTVSIGANGTTVTGVGSNFTYASAGQRLVPGTVDVNLIYPYITTAPTVDTSLELSGPISQEAISAGTSYVIDDSLPDSMVDYSRLIVDFAVMTARNSDKAPGPFKESFELFQRGDMRTRESATNRTQGTHMVDPFL